MQNQLNYYSRYNRIKVEDKKQIPSLYSLLSFQTLTKLAHDASVNLQMISHYKKQKLYHSMVGDHQTDQSEYLQANNLFTFRSFQSDSVDKNKSRDKKNRQSVHVTKKKAKINQKNQQEKQQKQSYLENLVRQVRSKSIERLQGNSLPKESIKRQKRSKKKSILTSNQIQHQQIQDKTLKDQLENSKKYYQHAQDKKKSPQIDDKIIHKKLIKSLVSEQNESLKQSFQKSKIQHHIREGRNQYVESIDDENEKQLSGPSIVLQRLNFKVDETHPFKTKDQIKEKIISRVFDSESKQDNPSSNDGKQSEIKSFSKDIELLKRPFKNLIELQMNHSQSQIWQPQERSLEIHQFSRQENYEIKEINNNAQNNLKVVEANLQVPYISQNIHNSINKFNSSFLVHSQIQQHKETIDKVNFLSQLNQQKNIDQPPFEHPLQTANIQPNLKLLQIQPLNHVKKSFKKFILNKQLNARLVTSTILNERNQRNIYNSKQKLKKEIDQNQNQKSESPIEIVAQKSQKVNFKALIMKKKQTNRQENLPLVKEKPIPLRKLQNQKLLQAFFNNN